MGIVEELSSVYGTEVITSEPMKKHTTFKLGGKVDYFIKTNYLVSVKRVVEILNNHKIKYRFLGNGSNLLVSDSGFKGAIIKTMMSSIAFEGGIVTATSGVNLSTLSSFCISHGLSGVEGLSSIPATIGGAINLNASAFGCNISDYLLEVDYLHNGKVNTFSKNQCKFGYRKSIFNNTNKFIISGKFNFEKGKINDIREKTNYLKEIRNNIQPKGNSCGSVFKNTKLYSAGELIERANLKGVSIGGATISDKHANFIITNNYCLSSDVFSLINYVKKKVFEKFDIMLNEEVEYLGEFK